MPIPLRWYMNHPCKIFHVKMSVQELAWNFQYAISPNRCIVIKEHYGRIWHSYEQYLWGSMKKRNFERKKIAFFISIYYCLPDLCFRLIILTVLFTHRSNIVYLAIFLLLDHNAEKLEHLCINKNATLWPLYKLQKALTSTTKQWALTTW